MVRADLDDREPLIQSRARVDVCGNRDLTRAADELNDKFKDKRRASRTSERRSPRFGVEEEPLERGGRAPHIRRHAERLPDRLIIYLKRPAVKENRASALTVCWYLARY